jgi:hypothetical protein
VISGVRAQEVDAKSQARTHFDNGVAAFQEKRFADAAQEFGLAYTLSPAFQVLYNIGKINIALGRHVEAVRALGAYLTNGGSAISPERRLEVEAELEKQHAFVSTITITVFPDGADISLDGERMGRSPLSGPLLMVPGPHTVEAVLVGYQANRSELMVRAGTTAVAELRLQPILPALPDPLSKDSAAPTAESPNGSVVSSTGSRRIGYVIGAGGAILGLTAGGLALIGWLKATSAKKDLRDNAPTGAAYDKLLPAIQRDYASGSTLYEIGLVGAGVGTVAAGVGVLLVLTAPSNRTDARKPFVPVVGLEHSTLTLDWSW